MDRQVTILATVAPKLAEGNSWPKAMDRRHCSSSSSLQPERSPFTPSGQERLIYNILINVHMLARLIEERDFTSEYKILQFFNEK
jgi:hypothetical protein